MEFYKVWEECVFEFIRVDVEYWVAEFNSVQILWIKLILEIIDADGIGL